MPSPGETIENARTLVQSIFGNAFEDINTNYWQYIQDIAKEQPVIFNPNQEAIAVSLRQQIQQSLQDRQHSSENILALPWPTSGRRSVRPSRLAASVIAFSDVQGERLTDEFFPVEKIKTFLFSVQEQAASSRKPLTLPEQFAIALSLANNNPMAAAILAHSSYRIAARGKDTRISPDFALTNEQRMDLARSTADFHTVNSPSRDPLGDTYHWWGSFSAGMNFALEKWRYPVQTRVYRAAFYNEAFLTTVVRKVFLKKTSISNHHKDVDRQGLAVGKAMGNYIRRM